MSPCGSSFAAGLIAGAGSLALIQALVIWWLNRMPKRSTPDEYYTICTQCSVSGSSVGRE